MDDELEMLVDMLPFLIPVFLIEIALLIFALIDLFKREHIDNNTRIIWAVIIILFGIIGPVIYFIFGRKENPVDID